jgi:nitroreductase
MNHDSIIESILTRRSIRVFANTDVEIADVQRILDAGLSAPSSKNSNPWFFLALGKSEKQKLIETLETHRKNIVNLPIDPTTGKPVAGLTDSTDASMGIIKNAPVLILIFNTCPFSRGKQNIIDKNNAETFGNYVVETIGIGAAVENMLLAAHMMGLGGVCLRDICIYEDEIKNKFNISYDLICGVSIGHPLSEPGKRELKENLVKFIP